MPNIQAITRERHGARRWRRYANYAFAAGGALAFLVMRELPKAVPALPVGFLAVQGGAFMPVAIQGLRPGKNLFVARDGRWLAGYVPAAYRCHPFVLANGEDGKQVLCVDEDSGLLSDTDGERFFAEDGQPSKAVDDVLKILNQIEASRQATQRICAVLQKHDLIQPWPIKFPGAEGEQNIEGLYRVDEAAMNRLPAEPFMELRDAGALALAYCQLLSMQHLSLLGKLVEAHAKADAKAAQFAPELGKDLDLSFLSDGGTLNFDGFR
ncbi:MAG: hypothetical protein A3G25_05395 [Betaproteobacteria bacterium RIFCSPLOWO2_12_FULL_63_13]|nr:MAG: hypothetical protein A3G25_05395 [Betaproteobacteria bacterium RIFCSPLOWO2_12_FULL_63_13]